MKSELGDTAVWQTILTALAAPWLQEFCFLEFIQTIENMDRPSVGISEKIIATTSQK